MSLIERLGLKALHQFDPETAHGLALGALNLGLAGGRGAVASARLATTLAGLALPNPIGVSAGFDKNARAVDATLRTGVGFCEIGAVTPRPQYGNLRPRLFRLPLDLTQIAECAHMPATLPFHMTSTAPSAGTRSRALSAQSPPIARSSRST